MLHSECAIRDVTFTHFSMGFLSLSVSWHRHCVSFQRFGLVWFGRWIQCQVNLHIFKLWKWNNWERQSVFYNHRRLSSAKLTLNVNCICSFHLFHCGHLWRLLCATKQCNQRERIQLQPQLWSTRAHTSFLLHLYVLYRRI